MNTETDIDKTRLLRQVVESVMWELDSVRQGRWEELPNLTQKKQELLKQMENFDWTPSPHDRENPEIYMMQAQIVDLEFQLRKTIESHLNVLQTQLNDLQERASRWRNILNPYRLQTR